jgi:phosphoglycerate dehydrogenase-like enzyme
MLVTVPGSALQQALGPVPGVEVVEWDLSGPPPRDEIDVVVPPYMGAASVLSGLSQVRTRLVQSQSIGYDGVADVLPPGIVFANAASVHETSTAELVLALVLASQRGIPGFVRAAKRGEWAYARHTSLADRRVLLVGYGGVNQAVEARLQGFEVSVTRVASRAREGVHGVDELPELLPLADVVVVCTPLSDSTRGLIGEPFLAALPDGALVVNVARGPVADTDAVLRHATAGRLRFALDVTDPEPLPAGHPLWALPNVLVSPHVGGATSAMRPRLARLLRTQVERLLRGEQPLNVVLRT